MLDNCPYCNSKRINKNGHKCNKQRYICRDCHKSFCEEDARVKRPNSQRELALILYTRGVSFRSIQKIIELYFNTKISHSLIMKWIKTLAKLLKSDCKKNNNIENMNNIDNKDNTNNNINNIHLHKTIEILELDELYTYYYDSKKNSKNSSSYGLLLTETDIKLIHLI